MVKHDSFISFISFYLFSLNTMYALVIALVCILLYISFSKQTVIETMKQTSCETCPPCANEGTNEEEDDGNGSRKKKKKKGGVEDDVVADEDAIPPSDPDYKNLVTIRQQRTVQNKTFLGEVSKIFSSLMLNPETSFCEHNKTNGGAMQKQCSALTHENCSAVSCCIWGIDSAEGTSQCMVGGKDGAMYSTDIQGNPVNIDTYYYQNKCFGENCPLKQKKQ